MRARPARRSGSAARARAPRRRRRPRSGGPRGRRSRPAPRAASSTRQRTTWCGRHDDRPDRRQVAGDRRDDEVAAVRVQDRAAGRERVAGRSGRAGHDEPVGDERREVRLVDGDVEPDHPRQRAAGDDDVVERGERAAVVGPAAPAGSALRAPSAASTCTRRSAASRARLELVRLGLRQEAHLAEVDAQDRHVDLDHGPDRPQERAVAAEHDQHVGVGQARARASRSRSAGAAHWSMPRIRHQPAARSRSSTACSMVGLYAKPIRRRSRVPSPTGPRRPRPPRRSARRAPRTTARLRGGRGTRGCPPGPGSATRSRRASPARARAAVAATVREHPPVDGRITHDPALRVGRGRPRTAA